MVRRKLFRIVKGEALDLGMQVENTIQGAPEYTKEGDCRRLLQQPH